MEIALLLGAFVLTLAAASRSLGWGVLAVCGVGYFNGVIRANYPGIYTSFMFDAAMLAFYVKFYGNRSRCVGVWSEPSGRFVVFLIAWPCLLSLFPANNILVQLVALRATAWMLPMLLAATRMTAPDLAVLARGLAVLNLMTLAVGIYLFRNGIEALYPFNAITKIMYNSNDVAGYKFHRIPSTFLNAHAYGGTMLMTLPFLLDRAVGVGARFVDRGLAAAGVAAAAGGLLMCGARFPLILLALALAIAWVVSRFSAKIGIAGAVLLGSGLLVAGTSERFQRIGTLDDTNAVANRITGSANDAFWTLMMDYPMGAGMGSSVGTSIPFFLAELAPEPIGLENEYSRILVDQGWVGLGGWLAFVGWLFLRPPPPRPPAPWRLGRVLMYSLCLGSWLTAFIGTGLLSSIPGTALLLTQMGILAADRRPGNPKRAPA